MADLLAAVGQIAYRRGWWAPEQKIPPNLPGSVHAPDSRDAPQLVHWLSHA